MSKHLRIPQYTLSSLAVLVAGGLVLSTCKEDHEPYSGNVEVHSIQNDLREDTRRRLLSSLERLVKAPKFDELQDKLGELSSEMAACIEHDLPSKSADCDEIPQDFIVEGETITGYVLSCHAEVDLPESDVWMSSRGATGVQLDRYLYMGPICTSGAANCSSEDIEYVFIVLSGKFRGEINVFHHWNEMEASIDSLRIGRLRGYALHRASELNDLDLSCDEINEEFSATLPGDQMNTLRVMELERADRMLKEAGFDTPVRPVDAERWNGLPTFFVDDSDVGSLKCTSHGDMGTKCRIMNEDDAIQRHDADFLEKACQVRVEFDAMKINVAQPQFDSFLYAEVCSEYVWSP